MVVIIMKEQMSAINSRPINKRDGQPTIGASLGNGAFTSSPPHRDTVDDVALLGLVPQPAGLVGPGWPWSTVHLKRIQILKIIHNVCTESVSMVLYIVSSVNCAVCHHFHPLCRNREGGKNCRTTYPHRRIITGESCIFKSPW